MPMPAKSRTTATRSSTEALCAQKKAPPVGRGAEVFEDAHANNGVSWQGLECPNGKRMSLESILNFEATWLSSPGPNTVSPICAQSGTGMPEPCCATWGGRLLDDLVGAGEEGLRHR